ncbi:MAG: hypothetical protein J6S91_08850 [Treponema sp.]|nr:hypothetical protein [Treponema sp.]
MKRMVIALMLLFVLSGCTMFDAPEGNAELTRSSIHTRVERPTANEEIVYCSCDVKITNTGERTIYGFTITAVATSDKGVEHYITTSYEVTIPPSQSIYVTLEWSLVRQIESSSVTVSETQSNGRSDGHSETASTSDSKTDTKEKTGDPKGTESETHTEGSTTADDSTETSDSSVTTSTTTTTVTVNTDCETDWNRETVKVLECFFN